MDDGLRGRHVVITGGDGALGQAVVEAFVAVGAICHLPILGAAGAAARPGVELTGGVNCHQGHLTCQPVAEAHGLPYQALAGLL